MFVEPKFSISQLVLFIFNSALVQTFSAARFGNKETKFANLLVMIGHPSLRKSMDVHSNLFVIDLKLSRTVYVWKITISFVYVSWRVINSTFLFFASCFSFCQCFIINNGDFPVLELCSYNLYFKYKRTNLCTNTTQFTQLAVRDMAYNFWVELRIISSFEYEDRLLTRNQIFKRLGCAIIANAVFKHLLTAYLNSSFQ